MIELTINGEVRAVDVEDDMPLLWVLRDELGLTGTKFGCGQGLCGACTVHLDGRAARACQTPVASVGAAAITTIEGLSQDSNHPLQRAWVETQAPQCGYCQSGQIMQAADLLAASKDPDDTEIDAAMWGNLCRCGAYTRIRAAIRLAARSMREDAQ